MNEAELRTQILALAERLGWPELRLTCPRDARTEHYLIDHEQWWRREVEEWDIIHLDYLLDALKALA